MEVGAPPGALTSDPGRMHQPVASFMRRQRERRIRGVSAKKRVVEWVRDGATGIEFAEILLEPDRLEAVGVAISADPVPYRLDYQLETGAGFVTTRLRCTCRGEGWSRSLDLRRGRAGGWRATGRATGPLAAATPEGETDALAALEQEGESGALAAPGGPVEGLAGALDCDLGFSPLTNTLPFLRERMAISGGSFTLLAAWVSVPDLQVRPDLQRYTVVQVDRDFVGVRYEAGDGSFTADITFDRDGIVLDYPQIARRV
jgi:uncharacterized protein